MAYEVWFIFLFLLPDGCVIAMCLHSATVYLAMRRPWYLVALCYVPYSRQWDDKFWTNSVLKRISCLLKKEPWCWHIFPGERVFNYIGLDFFKPGIGLLLYIFVFKQNLWKVKLLEKTLPLTSGLKKPISLGLKTKMSFWLHVQLLLFYRAV